jgi:hypothetical protein
MKFGCSYPNYPNYPQRIKRIKMITASEMKNILPFFKSSLTTNNQTTN